MTFHQSLWFLFSFCSLSRYYFSLFWFCLYLAILASSTELNIHRKILLNGLVQANCRWVQITLIISSVIIASLFLDYFCWLENPGSGEREWKNYISLIFLPLWPTFETYILLFKCSFNLNDLFKLHWKNLEVSLIKARKCQ